MTLTKYADTVFLITDAYLLISLDNHSLTVAEICKKTNYSRDTVNTILSRLLEKGIVERSIISRINHYKVKEDYRIEVSSYQKRIIRLLYTKYKSIISPNVCRLVFLLLDKTVLTKEYLVSDMQWKESSANNSIRKLKRANIISIDKESICLSDVFISQSYNHRVGTVNLDSYNQDIDAMYAKYETFLEEVSPLADFWVLNEIKVCDKDRFENIFKDYLIVYPLNFTNEHLTYSISILLVRKAILDEHSQIEMKALQIPFDLRYTNTLIKLGTEEQINILGLHIPQSCNASTQRLDEIKETWRVLLDEAKKNRIKGNFIVCGDLNAYHNKENGISENGKELMRLSDLMIDTDFNNENTWTNKDNPSCTKRLDYIFANASVFQKNYLTLISDISQANFSDHKTVVFCWE